MRIIQNVLTNAQHHRAMPVHQRGKSRLILPADELAQQLAVAQVVVTTRQGDMPDERQ
jgi:hypothetical protein